MRNDTKILGINERYYPDENDILNPPCLLYVLVSGEVGDYAAYCGYGSPEFVARMGNKITFEEAAAQFPGQLERSKYRHF